MFGAAPSERIGMGIWVYGCLGVWMFEWEHWPQTILCTHDKANPPEMCMYVQNTMYAHVPDVHDRSVMETRQRRATAPEDRSFVSGEKMSCLRQDSNPQHPAYCIPCRCSTN